MKGGSLQMVTEKFRFPDGHCFNAWRKNEKMYSNAGTFIYIYRNNVLHRMLPLLFS